MTIFDDFFDNFDYYLPFSLFLGLDPSLGSSVHNFQKLLILAITQAPQFNDEEKDGVEGGLLWEKSQVLYIIWITSLNRFGICWWRGQQQQEDDDDNVKSIKCDTYMESQPQVDFDFEQLVQSKTK